MAEKGIRFETATRVTEAVCSGFNCLLTRDVLFAPVRSTRLAAVSRFRRSSGHAPTAPWVRYRETFLTEWERSPIVSVSGDARARLITLELPRANGHWP